MKTYTVDHVVDFSWNLVVSLFWKRYPNPHAKHVKSEDVIERHILDDGRLYTKRAIVKSSTGLKIPEWISRRAPAKREVIIEESFIDPANQKIETITRNVGHLSKYAIFFERCLYVPVWDEEHHRISTAIRKTAWAESTWSSYLIGPIIAFALYRYKSSAINATKGLHAVCEVSVNSSLPMGDEKRKISDRILTSATVAKDRAKELAATASRVRQ